MARQHYVIDILKGIVSHGAAEQSWRGRGTVLCLLVAPTLGHPSLPHCASGFPGSDDSLLAYLQPRTVSSLISK